MGYNPGLLPYPRLETPVQELLMYADQKAELKQKVTEDEEPICGIPEPHQLYHPDAPEVENIVRTAWSNARLVAE